MCDQWLAGALLQKDLFPLHAMNVTLSEEIATTIEEYTLRRDSYGKPTISWNPKFL